MTEEKPLRDKRALVDFPYPEGNELVYTEKDVAYDTERLKIALKDIIIKEVGIFLQGGSYDFNARIDEEFKDKIGDLK